MLDIKSLKITSDHQFLDAKNHITPYISIQLQKIYPDVLKGKKNVIDKLLKLITRFPKVPVFKNYLTTAYMVQERKEKGYEANRWLSKEHPDYLFGKTNLSNEYLDKDQPEKVPEVLGIDLNLQLLYPEREQFHEDEVMAFYIVVVRYLIAVGEYDQAEIVSKMLKEINPLHPKINALDTVITDGIFKKMQNSHEEELAFKRTVKAVDRKKERQTTIKPTFNYPEQIDYLYTSDLPLATERIDELLALDKTKLGEDLILVLKDSIERFDYFYELSEKNGWDEDIYSAPIHSLFFLCEIQHPEALTQILDILRQDEDYVEFWFGDIMGEILPASIYFQGKDQLDILFNFIKEPNVSAYSKDAVISAMAIVPYKEPHREEEVVTYFKNILTFYIKHNDDETIADTDFMAFMVSSIASSHRKELLLLIKMLFEKDAVNYWISGKFEELEQHFNEKTELKSPVTLCSNSVKEMYQLYKVNWIDQQLEDFEDKEDSLFNPTFLPNYEDKDDYLYNPLLEEDEDDYYYNDEPVVKDKKIGRNDPCPCGSGKKYKKCCINTGKYE
ncbi:DUF1186 domain-containing protein [Aquimarina sp. ERC-38]|uniref:DUF1186 domain-containing protein n=1 Tax=Aquimarina sp. ERC-38 TaxID=2949996 RepID=UPI00224804E5|nr:DUF1186 domain-containing protein [Aquimarina sp. ERC-38]UZO81630.1 DUF1186 domain-containing protein [Aquimarina sp. ERC-38]